MRELKSAKQILQTEGVRSLVYSSVQYLYPSSRLRDLKYRVKYGELAPRRKEIVELSPQQINQTLPSANHSQDLPTFGICGGDWDRKTKDINGDDQFVTAGLVQRYKEGYDWEDTIYYHKAIAYLQSNRRLTQLDSYEQSEDGLRNYFSDLDDVFNSLNRDGFKNPSELHIKDLPKIHFGRNGDFILTHGHHRTIMCRILGISTIFARVGVRHSHWQKIRVNEKLDQIPEDHPDNPNK